MTYLSKTYETTSHNICWTSNPSFNTVERLQELCNEVILTKGILTIYLNQSQCIRFNGEKLEYKASSSSIKSIKCKEYPQIKDAIEEIIKIHKAHS